MFKRIKLSFLPALFIVLFCQILAASTVLVTGGAGYIGSHVIVELLNEGDQVILLDKQITKQGKYIPDLIKEIVGNEKIKNLNTLEVDLLNNTSVHEVFENNNIDAVIHLAGLKSVKESVENPLLYYQTNILSTINLLNAMKKYNVRNLVFSSSATVYGEAKAEDLPLKETAPLKAENPYGQTKVLIERVLMDLVNEKDARWHIVSLRYFNPIGANDKGRLSDFQEIPNNVMPYIIDVLLKKRDKFVIHGNNYNTKDGTAIRDYVHIVDLAKGHVAALKYLKNENSEYNVFNLGTGKGHSVKELVDTVDKAIIEKFKDEQLAFPWEYGEPRPGDVPQSYADPSLAKKELGFEAIMGLDKMVEDSIRVILKNQTSKL